MLTGIDSANNRNIVIHRLTHDNQSVVLAIPVSWRQKLEEQKVHQNLLHVPRQQQSQAAGA